MVWWHSPVNSRIWEAEAGGLGQTGLHSETLPQKPREKSLSTKLARTVQSHWASCNGGRVLYLQSNTTAARHRCLLSTRWAPVTEEMYECNSQGHMWLVAFILDSGPINFRPRK
jgi:hypothetical protein